MFDRRFSAPYGGSLRSSRDGRSIHRGSIRRHPGVDAHDRLPPQPILALRQLEVNTPHRTLTLLASIIPRTEVESGVLVVNTMAYYRRPPLVCTRSAGRHRRSRVRVPLPCLICGRRRRSGERACGGVRGHLRDRAEVQGDHYPAGVVPRLEALCEFPRAMFAKGRKAYGALRNF